MFVRRINVLPLFGPFYFCTSYIFSCYICSSYPIFGCVLGDFIFKKRINSNVQASRFVLTIRLGRFDVTFPHIPQMNPIFPYH